MLLLGFACADTDVAEDAIALTSSGQSTYRIVLPSAPTAAETKAAQVLQTHLEQISGARLPIVSAGEPEAMHEVILGRNERLGQDGEAAVTFDPLREDGFTIKTVGTKLIIAGGTEKGTLYGVYAFLEQYLGARKYSSRVKTLPRQPSITLGPIDDTQVPVITFRDVLYRDTNDPEYTDWHRLDHDEHGRHPDWGLWVHTFNRLVPPAIHYAEHPEYYAEVNGKRMPTQLCLTNEGAFQVLVDNLRKEMAKKPEATYWSVSQNDNVQHCTCDQCRALDEREGSPMGSLLTFVNRVAAEFPDKVISTLAYQYSRKPPASLRPATNVNIVLCSIESNRSRPIAEDPSSADFKADLQGWAEIADDLLIWDYVIQFKNLVSPFPNLHVLKPNLQFFVENGVTAMFEQGNREVGGEFAELRAYLIARLMWNPEADVEVIMDDFLAGYYGAAAGPIRTYIDEMHQALIDSGDDLNIFGNPIQPMDGYLAPERIDRYEALFDEAEQAVANAPEILHRVKVARLPLAYATLEQAKRTYTGDRGLFQNVNGVWAVRPEVETRLDAFIDLCNEIGVTRLKEWSTTPDEYRSAMHELLALGVKAHHAYGKNVTFVKPYSPKYPASGEATLTDGVRGAQDYSYNWLGFEGEHMEVVIDLEEVQPIHRIASRYYQDILQWIFLPEKVEYFISEDGETFQPVATVRNPVPADQSGIVIEPFSAVLDPVDARYVKVKAHSMLTAPAWHHGAGGKVWVFADEVVVE